MVPRYVTIIATGYAASLAVYSRLPGPYLAEDRLARPLIAFFLPTIAAMICMLLRSLWTRDPIRERDASSEATYNAIMAWVALFVIALHRLVLADSAGRLASEAWAPRSVLVLAGVVLIGIGNLLPRTRPNVVIGIRTAQMLANGGLWAQLHRACGYVVVSLGILIIVAGAFVSGQAYPQWSA